MAAPNIVQVSTIYAKTNTANLTTNTATMVVNNPASSGKVFKINTIIVSNANNSNSHVVTIGYYNQDDLGGTQTEVIKDVTVPNNATVIITDKNSTLYLEEDRSLGATANIANNIKVICSFEEIS